MAQMPPHALPIHSVPAGNFAVVLECQYTLQCQFCLQCWLLAVLLYGRATHVLHVNMAVATFLHCSPVLTLTSAAPDCQTLFAERRNSSGQGCTSDDRTSGEYQLTHCTSLTKNCNLILLLPVSAEGVLCICLCNCGSIDHNTVLSATW